jgi:hypothetical protein
LLSPSAANKRLEKDGSVSGGGDELDCVVVFAFKPGVAAAAAIRSFLLASRSSVLYNANTSFCMPDFAPMMMLSVAFDLSFCFDLYAKHNCRVASSVPP